MDCCGVLAGTFGVWGVVLLFWFDWCLMVEFDLCLILAYY